MKYKELYDSFKHGINNFWTPEEISMGEDKYQYTQLPENVRHFYDMLFAMLTTMDLVVTDALESTIMPWASAPEFRSWLALQGFQEAIHSHSYTLIAQEISADEDKLFNMYLVEKPLYDKIAMAAKYNELIEQASFCSNQDEAIKDFLLGYIFWAVMLEGIWFFLGLSIGTYPSHQFRMMKGTADQFEYIRRDESLHYATGLNIISQIIEEYPQVWDEELRQRIVDMVAEGLELEKAFATAALVALPGLTVPDYLEQCRFQANMLLKRLGVMPYPDAKQTLSWLTHTTLRKETNFFERRPTEYRVGADLWRDSEHESTEVARKMGWEDLVGNNKS
jgi:ribonucleoside-diphosphate reductase beta chain